MNKYKLQERIERLRCMSMELRRKQVFEWIKTGCITAREFEIICETLLLGC